MNNPYQLLGGDAGVRELAHAFYDVMDSLPGPPMFGLVDVVCNV